MNIINTILDEQRLEGQEMEQKSNSSDKDASMSGSNMTEAKPDSQSDYAKIREERAISEATASADATFFPSPSSMSSNSVLSLMSQVDGPSLLNYSTTPSIYTARSVPVALRGKLDIPIHVTSGGSVVEYTVECQDHDIGFGITAEREEGIIIVTEKKRFEAHKESITGKFLVGGVPCMLMFRFDNEYSWFTEKLVTYKITVTPPQLKNVVNGRRQRAKISLDAVKDDLEAAEDRMTRAMESKISLVKEIKLMEKELHERKTSLIVVGKEEGVLIDRVKLRKEQESLLKSRLKNGWEDERPQDEEKETEDPAETVESEEVGVTEEPVKVDETENIDTSLQPVESTPRDMPQDAPVENSKDVNDEEENRFEV